MAFSKRILIKPLVILIIAAAVLAYSYYKSRPAKESSPEITAMTEVLDNPESDASVEVVNPVEIDREDEEGGDAMMLMANDSDLEMLVSLDVLQVVNNRGSNNLNESRLCKGTLFTESSFLYNAYTTHNFIHLDYDAETDLLVTTTTVRI